MAKRKKTWAKALEAERIYRESHTINLDGFPGLLSPHIKGINPNASMEMSRKFRRKIK